MRRGEPELDDIRSHVIGEPFGRDPFAPEPVSEPLTATDPVEARRGPMQFEEPPEFGRPAGFGEQGKSYEIMDRLNMIEAQLSAIRSQTETINERLKNMEFRMGGRRY